MFEEKRVPRGSRESSWGAKLTPEKMDDERYEPKVYIPPVIVTKTGKVFEDKPFKFNPAESIENEVSEEVAETPPKEHVKKTPVWILLVLGSYIIVTFYKHDKGFLATAGSLLLLFVIWSAFRAHDKGSSLWKEWIRGRMSHFIWMVILPIYVTWTVIDGRWSNTETGVAAFCFIWFLLLLGCGFGVFEDHRIEKSQGAEITTLHVLTLLGLWKFITNFKKVMCGIIAFFMMLYLKPELSKAAFNIVWQLLWGPVPQ